MIVPIFNVSLYLGFSFPSSLSLFFITTDDIQTATEDGNVKYLCENLKLHYNHLVWILNCTVNVLIYSRMFIHNYCSFFWLAKLFLIRLVHDLFNSYLLLFIIVV